jgi:hypothetical protein
MFTRIPQSVAIRVLFKAFLSSDHVSAATGKTIAVQIGKNGGALANPNAGATNATEVSNGWYYVDLAAADVNTQGPLLVRGTEGTIDPVEVVYQVVDPASGGWSNLDSAVSSRSTYAGADTAGTTTLLGRLTSGRAGNLDNLDAAVTTRATPAQVATELANYDAPTFAELDARTDAIDAAIAAVQADTNDLQTRLPATLVDGRMDSNVGAINNIVAAAQRLALSAGTIVSGAAVTGVLSTTKMTTDLTEATDDHYIGRVIIWTSGVLINQATNITDYNGATKELTFSATTEAPSNGDTFIIV